MITGIGTDIVEIARFIPWITAPQKQLRLVFSEQEVVDCIAPNVEPNHIAERLAARFAAKEAFYKALSATLVKLELLPVQTFSLMFCAQHVSVVTGHLGIPMLMITWKPLYEKIGQTLPALTINLSLAHEKNNALAFVVISLYKEGYKPS